MVLQIDHGTGCVWENRGSDAAAWRENLLAFKIGPDDTRGGENSTIEPPMPDDTREWRRWAYPALRGGPGSKAPLA